MSKLDLDSIRHSKTELENQVTELQQRVLEFEDLAKANESREQTAQCFDLALWATNSSIWDWDVQRKLFWSSPGNQLLYDRGDDEITEPFDIEDDADPWPQHLHPDDREPTLQHLRDHLAKDTALDLEYRYRMPDGEYRWIRSFGRAVRAPDGTPLRVVGSSADITKRKRAEDEAGRFREAVDNASEGFALYDADERFVFANKRYQELYPEVGHLLIPGVQRETIRQAYFATGAMPNVLGRADEFTKEFSQRLISPGSFDLQLANGTWVKYSDHVLPDGGIVCVRTDITDIKQRDAYYQALFDSETVGVTITRADGSYVATNSVYPRMLGYSGAELLAMRWQDVSHADEIGRIDSDIHAMRAGTGSGLIFEKRFAPKDGGIVWARLNMALIHDESSAEPHQFALVENITQQVEAEQALRDSELRFRTIFEDAAIGIASVSMDGVMLQCNPAWYDMLGYERGELDGTHWSVFTHADDIAENKQQSNRLLSGEITSFQLEKRFIRKDGGVLWGRLTVSLVGKGIEHARFRIVMIEDITERKNAESALR
jgi:PAS domain S-box-containing protein